MITDNDFIIIMCGSRTWTDPALIYAELGRLVRRYGARLLIRHGDEPHGADRLVFLACQELAVRHIQYCATAPRFSGLAKFQAVQVSDWGRDGKAAGPIRNRAMRDAGADGLVAFRMPGISRGTDGMIALAREVGIPVIVRGQA